MILISLAAYVVIGLLLGVRHYKLCITCQENNRKAIRLLTLVLYMTLWPIMIFMLKKFERCQ